MTRWLPYLAACAIAGAPAAARAGVVTPKFERAISNIAGKSIVAVEVELGPGEASPPHHHASSAFIYVYVLTGTVRSQVEGEPARVYHAGESWYEPPGAHHVESRNLSASQPVKLLAVFVLDSNDKPLTKRDKE